MNIPEVLRLAYPTGVKKGPDKSFRVSPSRILKCRRGAFMESIGYSEAINVVSEQNFEYGTIRHTALQRKFVEQGLMLNPDGSVVTKDDLDENGEYKEEKLTYDDPPMLAYMDGRIKVDTNDTGQAVLELKTIGKTTETIPHIMYTHGDQATLYMHMTGIPEAYIVYEAKGEKDPDKMWKQFVLQYDVERAEMILEKGRKLMKSLNDRRLPLKDPDCWCRNPACFDRRIIEKENLKGLFL